MRRKQRTLAVLATSALAACSGGGGSSVAPQAVTTIAPPQDPPTISVAATPTPARTASPSPLPTMPTPPPVQTPAPPPGPTVAPTLAATPAPPRILVPATPTPAPTSDARSSVLTFDPVFPSIDGRGRLTGTIGGVTWYWNPSAYRGQLPVCAWQARWQVTQRLQTVPTWELNLAFVPSIDCTTGAFDNGVAFAAAPVGSALTVSGAQGSTVTMPADETCTGVTYCNTADRAILWRANVAETFKVTAP